MAIAYDTATGGRNWQTGDPQTWSHTCTGSDLFLVVSIFTASSTTVNGVTYNSTSMTLLGGSALTDISGNKNWVYYLAGPSTGTNTVSVDLASSANTSTVSHSLTGVDQTSPIDDSATDAGSLATASFTTSAVTVGSSDNWLLGCFRDTDNRTPTSSQVTHRASSSTVIQTTYDSAGTVATGSQQITYNFSPNGRIDGITTISVEAAAAAGGYANKVMGVASANIGKVDGVATANISKVMGA